LGFEENNTMILRFLLYGLAGWCIEISWTGLFAVLGGNISMQGFTYLWMLPIYGMGVFLEPIHHRIKNYPLVLRGGVWVILIFIIEYFSGWLLARTTGSCPWDYTGATPYSLNGYIRLDYALPWFMVGLLFERLHNFLDYFIGLVNVNKNITNR
jgi:uncharacterized membrane protein